MNSATPTTTGRFGPLWSQTSPETTMASRLATRKPLNAQE